MYEKYYGFSEKPFNIVPNPKFLYHSKKHENALTYLEYAISEGTGFTLLTGGIGTGKTTLIRYILNQVGDQKNIAVVFNTNVNSEQLFNLILMEFDLEPVADDKAKNLEILNMFLIDCYAKNIDPVLIIDEAQNLSNEVLEDVRMLTNLQNDERHLLQIILVGQPELRQKMADPALVQLNQRVNVRYHLSELSEDETAEYIATRLSKVGGNSALFDERAVALIYEASRGVPRVINLLCDSALVYGFADEVDCVTDDIVQQVIDDRGGVATLVTPEDAGAQPYVETPAVNKVSGGSFVHDVTAYETKLLNFAKYFKRFQLEQERQHAAIDDDLAEVKLLLEREKRKVNKLNLDMTRLQANFMVDADVVSVAESVESLRVNRAKPSGSFLGRVFSRFTKS